MVRFDPTNPIVEFTVRKEYAPHFNLSVLSVSPTKIANQSGDARYRLGSQKFTLNNPLVESIPIEVSANQEFYGPGERVELSLSIDNQESGDVPIEYAIAVIDESLLDLSSAEDGYFDPTSKRWALRARGLRTYGLIDSLMEDFDLLSLTPEPYWDHRSVHPYYGETVVASASSALGAGMGSSARPLANIRTLDRFVAYWNPSVISQTGQEIITFDLPDNLTSWKVVVLAVSATDRFGYATTSFGSIKDTEIRAVAPNVVTEGDKFHVGASILNRADSIRAITIELLASGLLDEESATGVRQELEFKPFERKVVTWEVQAGVRPTNLQEISRNSEIRVIASAGDSRDADALDIRIPVRPKRVRVSSVAYGALVEDTTSIPIEVPAKLATEDGQLDLTLTTNEEVNFDGVFRHAIEYPYTCWEQQLTQALLAMQYVELEARGVKHGIEWPDPKATIVRVLDSAVNFQIQNGGMVYFGAQDDNPYAVFGFGGDAYLSAYTAIAFSWLENAGYEVPQKVQRKLIDYLREYLDKQKEETELSNRDATINAVILNSLALAEELKESDLVHFSHYANQMKLFGLAHYLQASISLNRYPSMSQMIYDRIMNYRSLVDGAVEFVEAITLSYTQMLHSGTRLLCVVLDA
ncbi:MAG: hypothetical protein F4227_03135, partial [Gammaproteobacteria bacterium]|nr:hypothetical protein [Gammaproteobacteria bacterium]